MSEEGVLNKAWKQVLISEIEGGKMQDVDAMNAIAFAHYRPHRKKKPNCSLIKGYLIMFVLIV